MIVIIAAELIILDIRISYRLMVSSTNLLRPGQF